MALVILGVVAVVITGATLVIENRGEEESAPSPSDVVSARPSESPDVVTNEFNRRAYVCERGTHLPGVLRILLPRTHKVKAGQTWKGWLVFDGGSMDSLPSSMNYVDEDQTLTQIFSGTPGVVPP